MLNIDSLQNGIVIDHISPGKAMKIYELLGLESLDCCVAIIKNAKSNKYGKKDIIKIDGILDINFDVLGFVDSRITVCTISEDKLIKKETMVLPENLKNVVKCKNPRCISTSEEGIEHQFYLCDKESPRYRCIYCEQEYDNKN